MDISLLREFIVLAEVESFEKAADQLYTTQSTLSKHIKKMENELGITLFDRTTRNVQITEGGKLLLSYARQIEALEQSCLSELSSYKQTQTIKIMTENVSSYKVANYKLIDAFFEFQKRYPNYKLDISSGKMYEVYHQLISGQIDFAVFRYRNKTDMSAFVAMPFAEDRVVAVCSKHHRLASKKSVTLSELRDEELLLNTKESFMHNYIMDACKEEGFTPKVVIADNHMRDAIDLAALNMGIYFCMKLPAKDYHNSNISIIDLVPAYKCRIALCYNKRKLSPPAKEFWQFMKIINSADT